MHAKNRTLVLATTNAGKICELADGLDAHGLTVLGLNAFPQVGDIEETGVTFEENALLKARTVSTLTGLVAVADDSGLEVDALNGAPGVHSARFADDWPRLPGESRDARNIRKLLYTLKNIPDHQRTARFVSCMAACTPQGKEMVVQGTWVGRLLTAPCGENGFGYDPIFWDAAIQRTAAQLTREEKNARSHRGSALRQLLADWRAFTAT